MHPFWSLFLTSHCLNTMWFRIFWSVCVIFIQCIICKIFKKYRKVRKYNVISHCLNCHDSFNISYVICYMSLINHMQITYTIRDICYMSLINHMQITYTIRDMPPFVSLFVCNNIVHIQAPKHVSSCWPVCQHNTSNTKRDIQTINHMQILFYNRRDTHAFFICFGVWNNCLYTNNCFRPQNCLYTKLFVYKIVCFRPQIVTILSETIVCIQAPKDVSSCWPLCLSPCSKNPRIPSRCIPHPTTTTLESLRSRGSCECSPWQSNYLNHRCLAVFLAPLRR